MPQARDSVSPPVAVIIPGSPLITYGQTLSPLGGTLGAAGAVTISLQIVLILSDAPPSEKTQRALDAYLGIGAGETDSIAAAIEYDETLGGLVHWCIPVNVAGYNRIEYAAENYFGARINVQIGAI